MPRLRPDISSSYEQFCLVPQTQKISFNPSWMSRLPPDPSSGLAAAWSGVKLAAANGDPSVDGSF